jgi:hypothetical protein
MENIEFKVQLRWWLKYALYICAVLDREPPDWIYNRGLHIVQVKNKDKNKDDQCNA